MAYGLWLLLVPGLGRRELRVGDHLENDRLLGLGAGPLADVMARTLHGFTGEAIHAVLGVR